MKRSSATSTVLAYPRGVTAYRRAVMACLHTDTAYGRAIVACRYTVAACRCAVTACRHTGCPVYLQAVRSPSTSSRPAVAKATAPLASSTRVRHSGRRITVSAVCRAVTSSGS